METKPADDQGTKVWAWRLLTERNDHLPKRCCLVSLIPRSRHPLHHVPRFSLVASLWFFFVSGRVKAPRGNTAECPLLVGRPGCTRRNEQANERERRNEKSSVVGAHHGLCRDRDVELGERGKARVCVRNQSYTIASFLAHSPSLRVSEKPLLLVSLKRCEYIESISVNNKYVVLLNQNFGTNVSIL